MMLSKKGSCEHSLNNSSSKHSFSFGKANRFLPPVRPICDIYYDVPEKINPRSTSFGIGQRLQRMRQSGIPPPGSYKVKTQFEEEVQLKHKGFSFGYGRSLIGGPLEQVKYSKEIPGPGMYPPPSTLKSCNITLKPRLPDRSLAHVGDVPGPGNYELPSGISQNGRYAQSKYENSRCPRIVISKERIKTLPTLQNPGPGQYDTKTGLNPEGKYFSSKYDNSKVRSFSKGRRETLGDKHSKEIPGPGSYKLFSPFD